MRYEGLVYRPPSEAGSLIIQATLACPHNKCAFCGMYKGRSFRVRPLTEVIEDLDMAREAYGPHGVRTIFLADGNTAVLPAATLVAIGAAACARFPDLERITMYGSAKFLVKKSLEQWRAVAAAGITRIHSGLESGDAATLRAINKGVTPEQAVEAYRHVMGAGIELSVYLMVGLAGAERWREHALGSAQVLNQAPPTFVRLRTFVPQPGTPWHDRWRDGALTLLSAQEALRETRLLIQHLDGPTTLLSDHVSNFLDVRGRVPADTPTMLAQLDAALAWPARAFRPPTERLVGLGL
ncbi:MAG: radical SAM protein [Candidatus Rokubacteria bacterium]|nr:radical SAM protein [Candidatus Rokubacteria bacterium]